jgi:hypothetical protein
VCVYLRVGSSGVKGWVLGVLYKGAGDTHVYNSYVSIFSSFRVDHILRWVRVQNTPSAIQSMRWRHVYFVSTLYIADVFTLNQFIVN